MEYSKIISVTGLPGLYELLSSKGDGAIVRSLEDKSSRFVSSRVHNFSHLESIEIYTIRENVNLADVFIAMQQSDTPLPDHKNGNAVKNYFEKVYPDMDFERVYTSDMKKMIKWLDILVKNEVEIKAPAEEEPERDEQPLAEEPQQTDAPTAPETVEAKAPPKKKAPAKKKAVAEEGEAAPKKKAAPKKTADAETPAKKAPAKKKAKE